MVHHISINNSLKLYRQKQYLDSCRCIKFSTTERFFSISMSILCRMIYRCNTISMKLQQEVSRNLFVKKIVKSKILRMLQKEENKVSSLSPGFYNATVIKGVSIWYTDGHNKAREQNREPRNRPHQIQNLTCKLAGFAHHRRKV